MSELIPRAMPDDESGPLIDEPTPQPAQPRLKTQSGGMGNFFASKYGGGGTADVQAKPEAAGLGGFFASKYGAPTQVEQPKQTPKDEGGFIASAKRAAGAGIKGAGQVAADFIPGVDQDNAIKRAGQGIIDANPTAVNSLGDIADKPMKAVTEATGNAASSCGGVISLRH